MEKTTTIFSTLTDNQQCGSTSRSSYSWLGWRRQRSLSTPARKNKLRPVIVRVSQVVATTLRAGMKSISGNRRIYAGLWLLSVIGPLAGVFYQVFDPKDFDPAGYYGGPYWYFFAICPAVSSLIMFTGWYLLASPIIGRLSYILIVPLGYYAARIIGMSMATNNEEFHYIGWILGITGCLVSALWIFLFDFLMNLNFHKRDRAIAAIRSLINLPGLTAEEKIEHMKGQEKIIRSL